jgi:hypothetical protein
MVLQDYLTLVTTTLEIETTKKISENYYILEQPDRTFNLYQQERQIILDGSVGTPLKNNSETNMMLSNLLQFNLKRTQILDNIIFLDEGTQQLFFREILSKPGISLEALKVRLEDFAIDIKVIEKRFFP